LSTSEGDGVVDREITVLKKQKNKKQNNNNSEQRNAEQRSLLAK